MATKKEYQWLDNETLKGIIRVNDKIDFKKKTMRPFFRNFKRELMLIGKFNYPLLDSFIIESLNDFYRKISLFKKGDERNQKIVLYNELYQQWYKVNEAKQNRDLNLNSYYDDIIYHLATLGYHNR